MSIEIRKKNIARLAKRFRCKKITNLALEVKLPKNLFENICIATKTYVAKCIDSQNVILNELFVLQTTNSIKCYYPTLFFFKFYHLNFATDFGVCICVTVSNRFILQNIL